MWIGVWDGEVIHDSVQRHPQRDRNFLVMKGICPQVAHGWGITLETDEKFRKSKRYPQHNPQVLSTNWGEPVISVAQPV